MNHGFLTARLFAGHARACYALAMSHDHHNHHDHAHSHAPSSFGRAFAIGIALNTIFVATEVIYGFLANSVALLADAGHNASDVLGLVAAWAAFSMGKRAPTQRFTYGWKRSSILAALFNATCLMLAIGAIVWEGMQRLVHPEAVASSTIMAVAAAGIVVNGITAWLFASGRKDDLNIKGAHLHMLADALVSIGVVIAGFIILKTGLLWIDPAVSLVVAAVILVGTWGLLKESMAFSLDAVPSHIEPAIIRSELLGLSGVSAVHDLHIWPISTTDIAMTAHLVMPLGHPGDAFYGKIAEEMLHHHKINHVTLQIETDPKNNCALAPDDVV
jgi:cobalt-zinc-cadmium efflux system protein